MRTVTLNTIYDDFDFYRIVLMQEMPGVFNEAFAFNQALEMYMPKRAMSKDGISVLELMAGANSSHSELAQLVASKFHFNIARWVALDNAATSQNIKQDVRTFKLDETFDAITGFYYALCSIIPAGRESTLAMLTRVYEHLNRGGIFFTTYLADSFNTIVVSQDGGHFDKDDHNKTWDVPPFCTAWRTSLGIPYNKDPLELKGTIREVYNRVTGDTTYYFQNFRLVSKDDNDVVYMKFKIKNPTVIHYWGEPELTQMALEAGFKKDNVKLLDMDDNGIIELEPVLHFDSDEIDDTPSNALVLIKD